MHCHCSRCYVFALMTLTRHQSMLWLLRGPGSASPVFYHCPKGIHPNGNRNWRRCDLRVRCRCVIWCPWVCGGWLVTNITLPRHPGNHQNPLVELAHSTPITFKNRYNLKTISNNGSGVTSWSTHRHSPCNIFLIKKHHKKILMNSHQNP